jgi:hypothetical protein
MGSCSALACYLKNARLLDGYDSSLKEIENSPQVVMGGSLTGRWQNVATATETTSIDK